MWLSEKERLTLTVLGAIALLGLGVLFWQQRKTPIVVEPGPSPPYARWESMISQSTQVDLNRATAEDLERLPGIGPTLARRIVDYRQAHGPFEQAADVQEVPGIGPKTYEDIRGHLAR